MPELHQSTLAGKARIGDNMGHIGDSMFVECKDAENADTVSEISSLNVSIDEMAHCEQPEVEYIDRFVLDLSVSRGLCPHSIMIDNLSEWALERYESDRENFPQTTLQMLEDAHNRAKWNWLFGTMRDGTHGEYVLPHMFSTDRVLQFAKPGPNILKDIGNGMRLRESQSALCNTVKTSDRLECQCRVDSEEDFFDIDIGSESSFSNSDLKPFFDNESLERPVHDKQGFVDRIVRLFRKQRNVYKI